MTTIEFKVDDLVMRGDNILGRITKISELGHIYVAWDGGQRGSHMPSALRYADEEPPHTKEIVEFSQTIADDEPVKKTRYVPASRMHRRPDTAKNQSIAAARQNLRLAIAALDDEKDIGGETYSRERRDKLVSIAVEATERACAALARYSDGDEDLRTRLQYLGVDVPE
jgi:hypothetical protein